MMNTAVMMEWISDLRGNSRAGTPVFKLSHKCPTGGHDFSRAENDRIFRGWHMSRPGREPLRSHVE